MQPVNKQVQIFFRLIVFNSFKCCPKTQTHTLPSPRKCNRLLYCALNFLVLGTKTSSKTRQNYSQKAAELMPKGVKLATKVCTASSKICTAHQKKIIFTTKKIICTAKIAISTFYHTLGVLLSFWHTFSYFPSF